MVNRVEVRVLYILDSEDDGRKATGGMRSNRRASLSQVRVRCGEENVQIPMSAPPFSSSVPRLSLSGSSRLVQVHNGSVEQPLATPNHYVVLGTSSLSRSNSIYWISLEHSGALETTGFHRGMTIIQNIQEKSFISFPYTTFRVDVTAVSAVRTADP